MNAHASGKKPHPVVLCILDGWGFRKESANNAIALARTPVFSRLMASAPHALVATSGLEVGLPEGQMGNSEVGHMNIGGGRVVMQDLPRIDAAVADGSLARNPELLALIAKAKSGTGTIHLMGLLSPGGVHAHEDHILALAQILSAAGLKVWLHAFLDGRDTPPKDAARSIALIAPKFSAVPNLRFATVTGRYYAMDRDKRWDRIEKAYAAIVHAKGEPAAEISKAIAASYANGVTDEFVLPHVLPGYPGMADGDAVVMANFRADRARQIMSALCADLSVDFPRPHAPKFSGLAGLTHYSDELGQKLITLYPAERIEESLGEIVAAAGLHQLRLAETEKYPHVTYFFNGGREAVFAREDRIMIPSPKVATYDLQPEMSAPAVTDALVNAILGGRYDLIVVNFANPDMVGHTGDLEAAIKAVETIDASLGRVWEALKKAGGIMLLSADHGNVEMMVDPETGEPHTAHTLLDVPVVLVNHEVLGSQIRLRDGRLADLAPTVLSLMGLPQPRAMTGRSLMEGFGASLLGERERQAAGN